MNCTNTMCPQWDNSMAFAGENNYCRACYFKHCPNKTTKNTYTKVITFSYDSRGSAVVDQFNAWSERKKKDSISFRVVTVAPTMDGLGRMTLVVEYIDQYLV